MPRRLHLSVALDVAPDDDSASRWAALTRLAEQGTLDFVTAADATALTGVAPVTSRVGLVPAVPADRADPPRAAAVLAGLDSASGGRAGWLVDVPAGGTDSGRRDPTSGPDRWAGAADTVAAAVRLWDGRDTAATAPRPPQGRPPVAVALDVHDTDGQWELAALHAELVLLDADGPATARLARAALRRRVTEAGRDPDGLRVLLRLAVGLGGTGDRLPPAEARFTGTAADLAGLLADWRAAGGVDGFHLLPASAPADLAAVVHDAVPVLRERGLLRTAYTGGTLREHLGLRTPRPARTGH
ncbi:LLM class flavin-dependent oxidoreductase [Streptomyces sp. NPDC023723]|uniref:LLM class flavin-dependent oxidoreductase n=1 Tax=Streptomyces sp. NPDC023723 TaxID=3154323 RepID=UPI0034069960